MRSTDRKAHLATLVPIKKLRFVVSGNLSYSRQKFLASYKPDVL